MRNRILGIAGIAVLVISLAFLALGHGFQGPGMHGKGEGHGDMLEHMSRELNLTDAQKQQVKGIMDTVMPVAEDFTRSSKTFTSKSALPPRTGSLTKLRCEVLPANRHSSRLT